MSYPGIFFYKKAILILEVLQKIVKTFKIRFDSPVGVHHLVQEGLYKIIRPDRRTDYDCPVNYAHQAPDAHGAMQRAQDAIIFLGQLESGLKQLLGFRIHQNILAWIFENTNFQRASYMLDYKRGLGS